MRHNLFELLLYIISATGCLWHDCPTRHLLHRAFAIPASSIGNCLSNYRQGWWREQCTQFHFVLCGDTCDGTTTTGKPWSRGTVWEFIITYSLKMILIIKKFKMVDLPEVIKTSLRVIKQISENVSLNAALVTIFYELFLLWYFIVTGEYCINQTGNSTKLG